MNPTLSLLQTVINQMVLAEQTFTVEDSTITAVDVEDVLSGLKAGDRAKLECAIMKAFFVKNRDVDQFYYIVGVLSGAAEEIIRQKREKTYDATRRN